MYIVFGLHHVVIIVIVDLDTAIFNSFSKSFACV